MAGNLIVLVCVLVTIFVVSAQNTKGYPKKYNPLLKHDVRYLVRVVNGKQNDRYPCPGVVISKMHVLTTASCISSKPNAILIIGSPYNKQTQAISKVTYHPSRTLKKQKSKTRFENSLAVLTLKGRLPLGKTIIKARLPRRDVMAGDVGLMSGLTGVCVMTAPFIKHNYLTVTDSQACPDLRPDEFCVKKEPGIDSINKGAPVVGKGVILGFTTFGCNSVKNAVTNVFPYVDFIDEVMNETYEAKEQVI